MVGILKAEVDSFDLRKLDIRRDDHAVNDIVLGIGVVAAVIRLVEQAAGRTARIAGQSPSVGEHTLIQNARGP